MYENIESIQQRMRDIKNELKNKSLSSQRKKTLKLAAKVEKSKYVDILKEYAVAHGEAAKKQAEYIKYLHFGADNNKLKKNKKACDRGENTGSCRFCSKHIRDIIPAVIIGDGAASEWCVCGRNLEYRAANPCTLCHIEEDDFLVTEPVNIAEALSNGLNGNSTRDARYQQRLLSFMQSHIGTDYPDPETKKEYTTLRVWVNGNLWIEYYVKMAYHSSFLKTSSPSGYGYKDKVGLGSTIRIQSNANKDLIFSIIEDPRCGNDDDSPVVNGVGFWNLTSGAEPGEIRQIIQLNNDRAMDIAFKFLIRNPANVHSIQVDLVCTKKNLKMDKEVVTLWSYPLTDGPMNMDEGQEHTDSTDSSVSLSPVADGMVNKIPVADTLMGLSMPMPMAMHESHPQQQIAPAQFQLGQYSLQSTESFSIPIPPSQSALSTLTSQSQPIIPCDNTSSFDNKQYPPSTNHVPCNTNRQWDIPMPASPKPITFPPNPVCDRRQATGGKFGAVAAVTAPIHPLHLTTVAAVGKHLVPPTPPYRSLPPQSEFQFGRMESPALCNQMGRESSSVAPPMLAAMTNHVDSDMLSVIGGYSGNHIGFRNSVPGLPQFDRMGSPALCNQMGRDASSVAPSMLAAVDPDMMSVIGGYSGNHVGFHNFNRFDPLHGFNRPTSPFKL